MTCARCGHKAKTLVEMAKHMAHEHGDFTLSGKLPLPKPKEEGQ